MGASRAAARGCVLLVVSVMASLLMALPAHAAPVALSGSVVGTGGTPLSQVDVTVYSTGGTVVRETTTDSAGAWTTQVEPGTYTVGYGDPAGWYKPEFWDDRTTLAAATALTVPSTGRTGVAAQLARSTVVSGTLRSGGVPVAGAEVRAYASAVETDAVRTVRSAADGTYAMPLPAGTYRFAFESPDHAIEYWNDRTTLAASDAVVVGSTDLTGRDVVLTPLPVVSGRVTAGGAAVGRPEITVYTRDSTETWVEQETVTGDAQGRYTARLAPGRYTFRFAGDARHRPEFWADRPALSTADPVTLTSDPRTLDADLAVLPTVRGTVLDGSGDGVEDADVVLLDASGDEVASDRTGPDGAFGVPVTTGAYGLQVRAAGFRPWTRDADDPVLVGGRGADVGTVELVASQAIRGRVTGPDGSGVRTDVVVHAAAVVNGRTFWTQRDRVSTAADGSYAAAVPPGDYRIEVEGTEELVGEFWDDAPTVEAATTTTVGAADATGRDVRLAARQRPGVQGTVTTTGGQPLADAQVSLYTLRGGAWTVVRQSTTGPDGTYRLSAPAGTYRVGYAAPAHRATFGPGATTVETATSVTVGTGPVTRDARLVPVSARIQGTVRGPSAALSGIEVVVLQGGTDDLAPVATARTDAAGRYDVRVDAGRYVLAFADPAGDHRGEYFDDASTWSTAARVVVADGATVTGRDARLDAHPRLAGRVVTPSGAGVSDATVRLVRPVDAGGDVVAETTTDALGAYDVAAPAGTYGVEVLVDDEPRWTASSQALASGTTTRTITLADQRVVSGRLTGPDGRPAVGVEVRAWRHDPRDDTSVVAARVRSGTDGRYALPVAPGVYRIGFHGTADGYATGYAADSPTPVPDLGTARDVRLARADVGDVDGVLAAATGLSGTISDVAVVDPTAWPELEAVFYRLDAATGRWLEQERTTPGYGAFTTELPAGRYKVRVIERQQPYRTTHHGGGSAFSSAAVVDVVAGAVTPGVDVVVGSTLGTLRSTTAPSVAGSAVVGGTLTADPGAWSAPDVTSAYQWLRDGQPITGSTGRTYVAVPADAGRELSVRVVGSRSGYQSGVAVSPARAVAPGTLRSTSAPTLSRDPVVGTPVGATPGTWSASGVTAAFQWLRDGQPVDGAVGEVYTPGQADVGAALSVRVSGSTTGYTTLTVTSASRTVTDPPLVGDAAPTVTGTATIGSTLTAIDGTWNRTPTTVTRQWLRDGRPVAGATGPTYPLGADDVGTAVAVEVTAVLGSQDPVVSVSQARTVGAGALTPTAAASVTGTPRPGSTLTARPGTWTATDPSGTAVSFTYQWLRADVPIAGATSATYRPVAADLGRAVTVRVTARKPGHADATRATSALTVKAQPTLSVSAKGARRAATFTVVVRATGTTPTGSVRVRLGSRTLRTVSLSSYRGTRRAVLKVTGLARGTRTYTVEYRGNGSVEARTVTKRVTVR